MLISGCSSGTFNGEITKSNKMVMLEDYLKQEGVKAVFFKNKNGLIYKFFVLGRTNYAENGKDIVASATSVLTINTVNSLDQLTDTKINVKQEEISGMPYVEMEMEYFKSDVGKEKANVLIDSFMLGLKQINEMYGEKYLKVVEISDN
jgi:uncharacterized protein YsxB (DUF464 family)